MWAGMFMAHSSAPTWYNSLNPYQRRAEWSCTLPSQFNSDSLFTQLETADRQCHIPTVIERYRRPPSFALLHSSNRSFIN